MKPISSQADYDPQHYRFTRQSGLRADDFTSSRLEKAGAAFFSLVMSAAAIAMVLGLTFGWFQ